MPEDFFLGPWLGILGFVGIIIWLYWWMLSRNKTEGKPKSTPRPL